MMNTQRPPPFTSVVPSSTQAFFSTSSPSSTTNPPLLGSILPPLTDDGAVLSLSNEGHSVSEVSPLIQNDTKNQPTPKHGFQGWLITNKAILIRAIVVLVCIGIFIAAVAVRGRVVKATDFAVLGIICGTIILVTLNVYISEYTSKLPDFDWTMLKRPLGLLTSRIGSLIALVIVLAIMALVMLTLPVDSSSSHTSRAQSLFGLICFLILLTITSNNRKAIAWRTVWVGILLQFLLALFVLRTTAGFELFKYLANLISTYLAYSEDGYKFLFTTAPNNFAGNVFPAIIFFCATVELLYYFGILQAVIRKFATFFLILMGTSGAESVVAAASPFIGQGENALLVRPFIKDMTKSEIHQIMTSGFATISGSVLFGYISLGVSPQYLITAAIMSVPCAIALSKIRYPETEVPTTQGKVADIPQDERHRAGNPLQALGNGAKTGIKIVLIIAASLIAVLSLVSTINAILTWFGHFFNIYGLTLQKVLSYPFYPVAWLIGVQWADVPAVAELLALKLAANEFLAYSHFVEIKDTLSARTQIIITYALCGFANFSSVGIQIGILGAIAPSRLSDFANLAVSAMLTGALSTCFGALTAGMLY